MDVKTLPIYILSVMMAVIMIFLGAIITEELGASQVAYVSEVINNETLSSVNENVSSYISSCRQQIAPTFTLVGWYNATGVDASAGELGTALNTSDGTLDSEGGFLSSTAMALNGFEGIDINITYSCTYNSGGASFNTSANAGDFYQNVSEWWDTIGTFIGIGLILAVVGTAFYVGYKKFGSSTP